MAASLNKVLLMGNLTRDPEVKYTPKGTAVGDLGHRDQRQLQGPGRHDQGNVTYVDVEVWGRQAETCKQYLTKGRPVFIEGQLRLDQWEQDGQKKSKLKVRADRVQFLGGGPRSQRRFFRRGATFPGGSASGPACPGPRPPFPKTLLLRPSDDDIPF
jgi:single-strand DNA-binding protein